MSKIGKISILVILLLITGILIYSVNAVNSTDWRTTSVERNTVQEESGLDDDIETTTATMTADTTNAESGNVVNNDRGIAMIAAALATGLACIGAGIAVALVASSAVGAISENPSLLGKTIIFAGLAEGIAIYGLIISIMILNKF